jgi:hypothetical protein
MNNKSRLLIIFLIVISPSWVRCQNSPLSYVMESLNRKQFDGYTFLAANNSKFDFLLNKDSIDLSEAINFPLESFNEFVNNLLYPKKARKEFPKILLIKGEHLTDSIPVTDVGLLDVPGSGADCGPNVYLLGHRIFSDDLVEFLMLTDTQEGVHVEIYSYSKKEGRVLSYVPIFSGEKRDSPKCPPLGVNLVASYQTLEISDGIIVQEVNDGFNKPWQRRLLLNDDGYYEILWNNNPMRDSKTYKAVIDDADGYTNVRSYPKINSKVLYTIKDEEIFVVEEYKEESNWLKIFEYKGKFEGWIHKSRVKKVDN